MEPPEQRSGSSGQLSSRPHRPWWQCWSAGVRVACQPQSLCRTGQEGEQLLAMRRIGLHTYCCNKLIVSYKQLMDKRNIAC